MKSSLKRLGFGQLLSLLQATTGIINALLQEHRKVNAPLLQAALTYTTLALIFSKHHRLPVKGRIPLMGAAVFDVLASWMIVAAFGGLELSQVILLLGLSTPSAMLFNHFWKPRSYSLMQLSGIIVVLACVGVYYGSAVSVSKAHLPYMVMGALAALSYAASNSFQECACTCLSSGQFLFWLGATGSLLSWLAFLMVGREELVSVTVAVKVDWMIFGLLAGYVLTLSTFYSLIPVYLRENSAVAFNLSLLSANLVGAVGECFIVGRAVRWELMGAIGGLSVGLVIFYLGGSETEIESERKDDLEVPSA